MRAYHIAAFVALGFWQAAPVRPPGERFRFSVAGATGAWEDYVPAQFDCEGNQTSPAQSSSVSAGSIGARADVFSGDGRRRVTVVAGRSTAGGPTVGHGLFWGAEIGWEGSRVGASAGYRDAGDDLLPHDPDSPGGLPNLSLSLRTGRLDRVHTRVEWRPLSETPSLAGETRLGVAFGQAGPRQVSGFVGLVLGSLRLTDDVRPAAFGDLGIPVQGAPGSWTILVRGVYGPGHGSPNWGVGVGLRTAHGW